VGVTIALAVSGAALAKPHDDNPGQGHGHDKPHGDNGMSGPHGGGGNGMGGGNGGGNAECDPLVVDGLRAAVDASCPCAGTDDGSGGVTPWKNHGKYVRCVAHAVKAAARDAGVTRRCLRGAVPCAAQSACGKRGAEPCVKDTPDTCVGGACTNDPATPCVVDADCTVRACSVKKPDDCTASGGIVRSDSCCFGSPAGAFVDAADAF
jgi:hypothetical protein